MNHYSTYYRLAAVLVTANPATATPATDAPCVTRDNTDWSPSTWSLGTASASTPSDCCSACSSAPGCVVGVHYDSICYLKAANDTVGGAYAKPNVTSCRVVSMELPADATTAAIERAFAAASALQSRYFAGPQEWQNTATNSTIAWWQNAVALEEVRVLSY